MARRSVTSEALEYAMMAAAGVVAERMVGAAAPRAPMWLRIAVGTAVGYVVGQSIWRKLSA